ncbi:MAG: LLM class flavin-dependent oxidoreductase [Candidatus Binatia bacterium]
MRFGLFYLPTYVAEVHGSYGALYDEILDEAVFADENGLDTVWCAEHHFMPYGGAIPSVPVLLSAIAQRTKRIRIGSSSVCLPLHKPLELAEQLAMVDTLSAGRLNVGVARAFMVKEYAAMNVDMGESRARFDESMEVLLGLWTNDSCTHRGRFWSFDGVSIAPRVVQKPHPPIYVSCVMTRESFENAGHRGWNIMAVPYLGTLAELEERIGWYHAALREAGHGIEDFQIMVNYHFYAHEDHERAKSDPEEAVIRYLREFAKAVRQDAYSADYKGYAGLGKLLESIEYDFMYPDRAIFGTPEKIIDQIRRLEAMGVTEMGLTVNFGGLAHDKIMRSLEVLVRDIVPACRNREPARAVAS